MLYASNQDIIDAKPAAAMKSRDDGSGSSSDSDDDGGGFLESWLEAEKTKSDNAQPKSHEYEEEGDGEV